MKIFKDPVKLSTDFPFEILSQKLVKEDNCIHSYHWHDFYEISCVLQGRGSYFLNGERFDVSAGDILIFQRAKLHGWLVKESEMELEVMLFALAFLSREEMAAWENQRIFRLDGEREETKELAGRIAALKEEYEQKKYGYQLAIHAKLLWLLTCILRMQSEEAGTTKVAGDSQQLSNTAERIDAMERFETIIDYVNHNFSRKISLDEVADLAEMNANYFSSYFKKLTGVSFQEYLIGYRLERASEMREAEGISNAEAAARCGFHNLSNYYRLYKKYQEIQKQ